MIYNNVDAHRDQGSKAFLDGVPLSGNPYPERTIERRAWYDGWCWANYVRFNAEQGARL